MSSRTGTSTGPSARLALSLLAAAIALLALAPSAGAAVEVPFAARYAANLRGDVSVAANTLMTCPAAGASEADCLAARQGTASTLAKNNNNAYAMELVDADADAGTFDSSSSDLALPPGATVQFAGLYYGARTSGKKGALAGPAAPNPAARGTVLFKAPGALTYSSLAATASDSAAIESAYVGFVDVTATVAAAGAGTYTVANVQAGSGEDRYAGWSLVVAYSDPAAPPRSIRVFDGLASIQSGDPPLSIGIAGLETPTAGTVRANVGLIGYEGDRGSSGDRVSLGGKFLADASNPENNVFNSSIARFGADVTTKSPNFANQLGFDANLFDADGYLGNDVTATTLVESTNVEQY